MHGSCSSKRKDGTVCDKKSDCEADADICKQQDSNGNCPAGYTVDPEKAPGEECGCIKTPQMDLPVVVNMGRWRWSMGTNM